MVSFTRVERVRLMPCCWAVGCGVNVRVRERGDNMYISLSMWMLGVQMGVAESGKRLRRPPPDPVPVWLSGA